MLNFNSHSIPNTTGRRKLVKGRRDISRGMNFLLWPHLSSSYSQTVPACRRWMRRNDAVWPSQKTNEMLHDPGSTGPGLSFTWRFFFVRFVVEMCFRSVDKILFAFWMWFNLDWMGCYKGWMHFMYRIWLWKVITPSFFPFKRRILGVLYGNILQIFFIY